MPVLTIDDFKSQLVGGGARANLYRATITFPPFAGGNLELTSFMCSAASLPATSMTPLTVPFRGRQVQLAGEVTFQPWSVTIINDTNFRIRNTFERWMQGMAHNKLNTGLAAPLSYKSDMYVEQLDKAGDIVKKYDFRGCFPISVAAIELKYDAPQSIEDFIVQFAVDYFEGS